MPKLTRIEDPDDDGESAFDDDLANDDAISLEELQSAYSVAMQTVESDSAIETPDVDDEDEDAHESTLIDRDVDVDVAPEMETQELSDALDEYDEDNDVITPIGILEALLFVGNPRNKSYSAEILASLMRGVEPDEVEGFVEELNQSYVANEQAMHIVNVDGGYRLELNPKLSAVRDRMFGKIRETRLNQDAIDCLALVSYQPGITRQQIEEQTNQTMGGTLRMLVRRDLLRIESGQRGVPKQYHPTDRMMELFGLDNLSDLPHVGDID